MNYTGKEVCQGCRQPGNTKPRWKKDSLCADCESALMAGKAHGKELEPYVEFFQHFHAFHEKVTPLVHKILAALHNENITHSQYKRFESMLQSFGSNGKRYTIPERCYAPLKEAFLELDKQVRLLEKSLQALPGIAKEEVQKERDRIYNEGIEKGRNLLLQLESGGLSMDDFYKQIPYHKY